MILQSQEMFSVDADGEGHFTGHQKKRCNRGKSACLNAWLLSLAFKVCALVALHDYDVDVTTRRRWAYDCPVGRGK